MTAPAGPTYAVTVADADATVTAVHDGTDPPTIGKMSGYPATYRAGFDAAAKLLEQLHHVEDTRRVKVRVYDGRGEGLTTSWCAPSQALAEVRRFAADLDFQATLDRDMAEASA